MKHKVLAWINVELLPSVTPICALLDERSENIEGKVILIGVT
jgi:hypothetical protein